MRKIAISVLIAFALTGCKVFESKKDLAFEIGKEITFKGVKDLFKLSEAQFQKDTVLVSGDFPISKVQKVLGTKLTNKFTSKGQVYFDNMLVNTQLSWKVISSDTTLVNINFSRIKK